MLVVVRHAEAETRFVGAPQEDERPLSARGHRQAEDLVARLRPYGPTAIVSSPYRRAMDTVAPTAAALGLHIAVRADAREWDDGLETVEDWMPRYERCWREPSHRHGDGESHDELTARASACLRELLDRAGSRTVIAASHGTWIARGLGALGAPVTWDFWRAMPLSAVYEVESRGGEVSVGGPGLSRVVVQ